MVKQKKEREERRIGLILLIFNLFLFSKGISATYTASYLTLKNPNLIKEYMEMFQYIPYFYLIPIILFGIPYCLDNERINKISDSVGIISVIIITSMIIFNPL